MPETKNPQPRSTMNLGPHQQDFISQVVNSIVPNRFLLSAPPGAGKTVTFAALAKSLKERRGNLRCLCIAPAHLVAMWQEQLLSFGGLDAVAINPQTYRRLQAESGAHVNVWKTVSTAVASIDFLKVPGRMAEVLDVGWDLVLLDEVHLSTDSSQRGDVAVHVWESLTVGIAVAATQLPNQPTWLANDTRTTNVHWKLTDLLANREKAQRRVHNVLYTPTEAERQILSRVNQLVTLANKDSQSQFVARLLSRRLSSSLYAFEQTLRQLLTNEILAVVDLQDWTQDDAEDEVDDPAHKNPLNIDRKAGEQIIELLEAEPQDTKWECCFQLLDRLGIGTSIPGIIFTDYADTAEYLTFLAKNRGLNVVLITGASSFDERRSGLDKAREMKSLLIATGAVEGVNYSCTNQIIHYDIPWNPRSLEQRIGRVERVGSQFHIFDHYYILNNETTADKVLTELMGKMQAIEQAWM
jgi:superfamily II DNA or RNA helicase